MSNSTTRAMEGAFSKEQSEEHAHKEYTFFEKRRREQKEEGGRIDEIKQLEQASRKIEAKKKGKK